MDERIDMNTFSFDHGIHLKSVEYRQFQPEDLERYILKNFVCLAKSTLIDESSLKGIEKSSFFAAIDMKHAKICEEIGTECTIEETLNIKYYIVRDSIGTLYYFRNPNYRPDLGSLAKNRQKAILDENKTLVTFLASR